VNWEERFRHREWVDVWDRWRAARAAWSKTWPMVDFSCFDRGDQFRPLPDRIQNATHAATAREYLAARAEYHTAVKRFAKET